MRMHKSSPMSETVDCLGLSIRRTSRAVTSYYNERLAPAGLLVTQTPILFGLRLTGSATVVELARHLGMDQTTLSRSLKPLLRDGWVDLTPGKDHRQRHVRLTPEGVAKSEEAYALWTSAQEDLLQACGPSAPALLGVLRKLEAAATNA